MTSAVSHQGKVISAPILQEVESTWSLRLAQTAELRFRGRGLGVNTLLLATHYHIERFRELLLWSFFMLRIDADRDGVWSQSERAAMLELVQSGFSDERGNVDWFKRTTASQFEGQLRAVGLDPPIGTRYASSSADGFSFARAGAWDHLDFGKAHTAGPICSLEAQCFTSKTTAHPFKTFQHFAYTEPNCGDCLSLILLKLSGDRGLSAFLPSSDFSPVVVDQVVPTTYPHSFDARDFASAFPNPATTSRQDIASLLLRYQHMIGDTDSGFVCGSAV